MHEVDMVLGDELRQRIHVLAHAPGVLAVDRQREVLGARSLQLAHHDAAGRGDDRLAIGTDQRQGHVDGAALDAAGAEARQHLEHHRRSTMLRGRNVRVQT